MDIMFQKLYANTSQFKLAILPLDRTSWNLSYFETPSRYH